MIVFFSNFINEHQIPLCEALFKKTNGEFCFVATEKIWKERVDLGFQDKSDDYKYVLKSYENLDNFNKAHMLATDAEIVILGDAPFSFIEKRLKEKKVTFKYSERFFKQGKIRILDPRVLWARFQQDIKYRNKPFYLLCAGAYVADDALTIMSYPNKTYKWGYFPETYHINNIDEHMGQKRKNTILWVGRFIDWKHPEIPLHIAKALKNEGIEFEIELIGNGELLGTIEEMIQKDGLEDCVHILGAMPPKKVREKMCSSEIFIFTSDKKEGWGVVLNEAMNAGCAVVASHAIGSVPFLIKNGVNGLVYEDGNIDAAIRCVKSLLLNRKKREKYGVNAYYTILKQWNAETAAERLLQLSEVLLKKGFQEDLFSNGVCSKAEKLRLSWIKRRGE